MKRIDRLEQLRKEDNLANVRLSRELYAQDEVLGKDFQLEDVYSSRRPIYGTLRRLHEIMDIRGYSNPADHRKDRWYITVVA